MKIFLGADHGGFELKNKLFAYLSRNGYEVEDEGTKTLDPQDDYPQFAEAVVVKILGCDDADARGILVCTSGQGMAIAANRHPGIRASVVWDAHEAKLTRVENDSNVLSLSGRLFENEKEVFGVVETWLTTEFSKAPRHIRRLKEIDDFYPNS
jgi:RpiB/LacA/LacB family sugar-phosphate isomerase